MEFTWQVKKVPNTQVNLESFEVSAYLDRIDLPARVLELAAVPSQRVPEVPISGVEEFHDYRAAQ